MLKIGGVVPFTTIDFPDRLAAVVFCQGCPWQCGYCHNRHLLDAAAPVTISWEETVTFLDRRRGLLDAVVFSGGEPTMQTGLLQAIGDVRRMGFLAGLHTAGAYPEALSKLLPHLDWVGMDIKAPFPDYERITGAPGSGQAAERSAALVRESGVMHRFRTTVDPCLFSAEQVDSLRRIVVEGWGSRYDIQPVERFGNCNEATLQTDSPRSSVSQRSAATFHR
jgi:pyruvate formate lyase activating enzyme